MTTETGNGWTMHLGDCLDVLPTLAPVDHVITDPPYDDHVHAKSRRGGASEPLWSGEGRLTRCSFNRAHEFGFDAITPEQIVASSEQFRRVAKRWVLVFSNVELCDAWRGALVVPGFDYVRTGAWIKEAATPQFSGDRPAAGFETITIAHRKGRKRWNGGGKQGIWSQRVAGNQPGSIRPRVHTAQKPLELMIALVEDFTEPGETILDAFAGSGTTGIAALRLGRRFVGIEKDPKHFATACESLRAEEDGSTLQAQRAGQLGLLGGVK